MRPAYETLIREASLKAAPLEACGILVEDSAGKLQALEIPNTHERPAEFFAMEPEAYQRHYATGRVRAYWHSHPNGPGDFSEDDKMIANEVGLPCLLHDNTTGAITTYTPNTYRPPLVGRPFIAGINDCYALVRDYMRETYGIEIEWIDRTPETAARGLEDLRSLMERNGFVQVMEPQPGDVLAINVRSVTGRPNHAAVVTEPDTILHQLTDLPSRFDALGGFWLDSTQVVLRHISRC